MDSADNRHSVRCVLSLVLTTEAGTERLDVIGLDPTSVFACTDALAAADRVARALGIPSAGIPAMFRRPRSRLERAAWRNLASAIRKLKSVTERSIASDLVAERWNDWMRGRRGHQYFGNAQRLQAAPTVQEWIRRITGRWV